MNWLRVMVYLCGPAWQSRILAAGFHGARIVSSLVSIEPWTSVALQSAGRVSALRMPAHIQNFAWQE